MADYVKGLVGLSVILGMWYDLKSDFRVFKATTELRLNNLEKEKSKPDIAYHFKDAILPNETKLKDEIH